MGNAAKRGGSPVRRAGGFGSVPESEFVLELSEGQVIDAVTWPPGESGSRAGCAARRERARTGLQRELAAWETARGASRVLIEAPLDAGVVVRGGDQPVTFPLLAILERPQHTPAQSPLTVSVERLAWDSLAIDLGEPASDGIVAPGTEVPSRLGYNILWPESTEVAVRTTAVLRSIRGGDVLWRYEPRDREVVATNRREPPART